MKKQWSKSEYAFSMALIFLLVCIAVAFFYGFITGKNKAEAEYEAILSKAGSSYAMPGAYDQSQLVSFYYQSSEPFEAFRETWFEAMKKLERSSAPRAASQIIETLSEDAEAAYADMEKSGGGMLAESPLLKDAETHYLQSLKLFAQETDKYKAYGNKMDGMKLKQTLGTDPGIVEAQKLALLAQSEYYNSILKWNVNMTPDLKHNELLGKADLSSAEWEQLNLNQKNVFISNLMLESPLFANYAPQDLAVKIDTLLDSSQSGKVKFGQISETVEVLIATGAITSGDYLALATNRYENETLPLVPSLVER